MTMRQPASALAGGPAAGTPSPSAVRVASFPAVQAQGNPYQRLLYEHLAAYGVELVPGARLLLPWLMRSRGRVDVLHFHWPESYFLHRRGPGWLRLPASVLKLAAFLLHLAAARALGYRIVWTVHQLFPHESVSRPLERLAAHALARSSSGLLANDAWTAERARVELGRSAARIAVAPHGSYVGVYPPGRPRGEVRTELGLPADSFVFLCFGQVRRYKDLNLLLEAFAGVEGAVRLVLAGEAKDGSVAAGVRAAAKADPRIVLLLRFVGDEHVAELFGAADAAVVARRDGGTSGAVVLALSLGLPVVAARRPGYLELLGGEEAGWFFDPERPESLREALAAAAADPEGARGKRLAARRRAEELRWDETAARTALVLLGARRSSQKLYDVAV